MIKTTMRVTRAAVLAVTFAAARVAAASAPATSPAGDEARAGGEVGRLVAVVTNPDATWEERDGAERALAALPAGRVLPAVAGKIRSLPAHLVYLNGPRGTESPEADKDAPPEAQVHYSLTRVWDAHTRTGPGDKPELARLMADLLPRATNPFARGYVVAAIRDHWSDAAEAPLARGLRDRAEDPAVRAAAADALLKHRPGRYENEIRGIADSAGVTLKGRLFPVLTGVRLADPKPEIDPVVVMMGFELLERAARDSDADAALAYATQLGAYLDEPFSPDPADPVPVGQRGMKPHEVAVASARRWWAAHGRRIEAEVAKVKPRPA